MGGKKRAICNIRAWFAFKKAETLSGNKTILWMPLCSLISFNDIDQRKHSPTKREDKKNIFLFAYLTHSLSIYKSFSLTLYLSLTINQSHSLSISLSHQFTYCQSISLILPINLPQSLFVLLFFCLFFVHFLSHLQTQIEAKVLKRGGSEFTFTTNK